ncbi:MAG: ammonium transporter [Armatimonadetes bacterium]|nr:ammonium transporter [Armatimonadota bacterium]
MGSRLRNVLIGIVLLVVGTGAGALAAEEGVRVDPGDTAFILISAALVMLMTPGLALFYGGMVRSKNALATILQSFVAVAVISVQWVLWGYTLAFGPDVSHLIGSLAWLGLNGVGLEPNPVYGATIPHQAFMIYQAMFAIITPALITGAFAERKKFSAYLLFMVAWATLVYDPIAHWVWGGDPAAGTAGWLKQLGALDFAGGTVVHISSGVSALVAVLVMGKRHGYPHEEMRPHNLTMTLLGTALLWFGWFGFNAGSAIAAGQLSTVAFVTTNTAAASGALVWMLVEWWHRKQPTALGAASGAVAGLVGITPAAGFVTPLAAVVIGAGAGALCYGAVLLKSRLGYDDSLDTFGVHGVGGTWGALATGLFATTAVNAAGADGLFYGNAALLGKQAIGVVVTMLYAGVMTFLILKVINALLGLRVSKEHEEAGLDISQHGEAAYNL